MQNYKLALFVFICTLFSSCASKKLQFSDLDYTLPDLPDKDLHRRVFLVGDAGKSPLGGMSTALATFKKHLQKGHSKEDFTIYLGDNIYPAGLPAKGNKGYAYAKNHLDAQIDAVKEFKGTPIFIPGNHDWYADGLEGLARQEEYIEDALGKNTFLPEEGCPLKTVEISEAVELIIIDTQWYLENWNNNPTINDHCPIKTRTRFLAELEGELKKAQSKRVILAMHHPMFTNGLHGGFFSAGKHLYPTQSNIPLPILGSLVAQIRTQGGISIQDRFNERYNELMKRLETLCSEYDNIVVASGHEHTLQYIEHNRIKQIVSGSGAKEAVVALNNDGLFAYGKQGFAQLYIFEDGSVWVEFYGEKQGEPQLLYRKEVLPKNRDLFDTATLPNLFPVQTQASIYSVDETEKSGFHELLLGERYRDLYSTPVTAQVATLDTLYGGLEIVREGGGHQTRSLRLRKADGRELNMRALRKSATQYLQTVLFQDSYIEDDYDKTFIEDMILDFYTAAHPYAFLVVPKLSDAAQVYHTNPKLYYIPKHAYLGDYNYDYGDELYIIEERPEENYTNERNFGYADDIESTHDIISKIREDEKYKIDEHSFIRARLFDMLLGDWDRHQDQWRWAQFDQDNGDKLFRPIPRDRDQVFSNFDGAILDVMRTLSGSSNQLQVYDATLDDVEWINKAGVKLDKVLIQQSGVDVWLAEAKFLKEQITQTVIDEAFANVPKAAQDQTLAEIKTAFEGRLQNIENIAKRYANYLNDLVILTGTDKDDYIEVVRSGNKKTTVKISRIIDGKKAEVIVDRTFDKDQTKELWIYALDDKDIIEVRGKANNPIFTRIIGGQDEDTYIIKNGRRIRVYDHKSKENTIQENNGAKIQLTDIYKTNLFDFNKNIEKSGALTPSIGFNPDDGLILGLQKITTKKGFHRNPFTTQHTIDAGYFFATNGFSLTYEGTFAHLYGDWNLKVGGRATSDSFTNNFFGIGNQTVNPDQERSLDFNRVKTSIYSAHIGISKKGNFGSDYGFQMVFEGIKLGESPNRFIENFRPANVNTSFYDRQYFGGVEANYRYESFDSRITPTRAMTFYTTAGVKTDIGDTKNTFGYFNADLGFYNAISKDRRLVLKTDVRSQFRIGSDYLFYQAASIGGDSGLRGFRNERFTGKTALVSSADLRYAFREFKTKFLPLQFGVYIGGDLGRVWTPQETSRVWHNDYGGGLWVTAADAIQGNFNLFNSDEGLRFTFGFGLRF